MNTKHTPEPWRASKTGRIKTNHENVVFSDTIFTCKDTLHPDEFEELAIANAKRIVECVNACAGIPSEILTSPSRKHDAFFEAIELEAKNKELIALFQQLDDILSRGGTITENSVIRGSILVVLGKIENPINRLKTYI